MLFFQTNRDDIALRVARLNVEDGWVTAQETHRALHRRLRDSLLRKESSALRADVRLVLADLGSVAVMIVNRPNSSNSRLLTRELSQTFDRETALALA